MKVLLSRDAADGGNDTGKRASGVGASRKAEDIDFVALHPIERQERETALHVAAHAHAKDAAQKAVEGSTAADAGVVVDNLASIFFICGLNGLADPDDVGDRSRVSQRVPGAVVANDDAFHLVPPNGRLRQQGRGPARAPSSVSRANASSASPKTMARNGGTVFPGASCRNDP